MKVHHTSFHTASSVNAMASKMNCKFENKYIFLFFFFVIIIIIPINAITIGEGRNVTPPLFLILSRNRLMQQLLKTLLPRIL